MIVRISGEGQYRLDESEANYLNQLDNAVTTATQNDDEGSFRDHFGEMFRHVREQGERLPSDELTESDLILPPEDLSFEEAKLEFTGDGLIPD